MNTKSAVLVTGASTGMKGKPMTDITRPEGRPYRWIPNAATS